MDPATNANRPLTNRFHLETISDRRFRDCHKQDTFANKQTLESLHSFNEVSSLPIKWLRRFGPSFRRAIGRIGHEVTYALSQTRQFCPFSTVIKTCPTREVDSPMVPPFDIFRMKSGFVLWCEAAATIEMAQARIRELNLSLPGGYRIFNQHTGQHVPVDRFCSQVEYPIAKETPRRDQSCPEQHPTNILYGEAPR
jgi:hypothetical protein